MDIDNITKIRILVFGDFMIDKYIEGKVKRISPEAPVPVIEVDNKERKLGGAGNVVNNIISLGASVKTIGYVGDDSDGEWIINELSKIGVDTSYMKKMHEVKTISKTRVVSKNQQFLRIDEELIEPAPKEYENFVKKSIREIFSDIDVIIISDYNKGAVCESFSQLLIKVARELEIPVIVDPKGDNYNKYKGATICTPNTNELSIISHEKLISEKDVLRAGSDVCKTYNFHYLVLTRSEKGISLFKKDDSFKTDFPAVPKEVIDVTGAGDTVVATIALLYAAKFPITECCSIANVVASIVISKFGASTASLNELISSISQNTEFKFIDSTVAKYIFDDLREKGKKIVFTNGCFDLLHAGHLSSFKKAKSFGDILVVAVNSDDSVKRIKGDLRPIIPQNDRIELLCALECVDYVMLMKDDNPINLINLVKPDISVKGADWQNEFIPEKEVIESLGGKMAFIELEAGLSTTNIIDKIIKDCGVKQ